jgi:hypothetical protein
MGGAWIPLNDNGLNLESAGQTKISVAKLLTSLGICRSLLGRMVKGVFFS